MSKINVLLFSVVILSLPSLVFAAVPPVVGFIMGSIANTVLAVASFLIIILWVVTGVLFLTAQGDASKINKAKTALFSSVAGTVLIIIAIYAKDLIQNALGI